MSEYFWTGTTSGDPTVSTNYTPNGVPVSGDTVVVDGRATQAIVGGSGMSAVTLAVLRVTGATVSIGSNVLPLQISASIAQINAPPDDGSAGNGPPVIAINFGSVNVAATVYGSPNAGSGGLAPVLLIGTGSGNTLTVLGGNVGFGTITPGMAATLSSLTVAPPSGAGGGRTRVSIGSGVTLTAVNQTGGAIVCYAAVPTITQTGGSIDMERSGAITTATIGGTGIFNSTGTITTLSVNGAGKADFSQSTAARTVTTATIYGASATLTADNGAPLSVIFTNGVQCSQGAKSSQINLGTIKVTQS